MGIPFPLPVAASIDAEFNARLGLLNGLSNGFRSALLDEGFAGAANDLKMIMVLSGAALSNLTAPAPDAGRGIALLLSLQLADLGYLILSSSDRFTGRLAAIALQAARTAGVRLDV